MAKKMSSAVPATLLMAVAAATLTGCASGPTEVRRCVDAKGRVLPDYECQRARPGGYYGGYYGHWVYGGTGGNRVGDRVMNFRSTPSAGARVVTPGGQVISRGGFGGSGSRSFGG